MSEKTIDCYPPCRNCGKGLYFNSTPGGKVPNPILVDFRAFDAVRAMSTTAHSASQYLAALNDPDIADVAAESLDALYATPYRRGEREAQEAHARKVLTRLAAQA